MSEVWGVWFLIGAALVFFMQCGFAMVETGFTRAKNAGNIIMKNLMDFCIGTPMFMLLGFGLMMSENYLFGFIGKPHLQLFTNFAELDWSAFVFNLVFCATAATIVSGAMAERTKFSAYCIYSAIISAIVYPIEAGWVWNSQGWLVQLGFVDFAGSAAIHSVGGTAALIGAIFLGPRIGKYDYDKDGKVTKVHAIPGHSLTLGALGTFILWFGWYGFNGAACTQLLGVGGLAAVFTTTTIAPAVAAVTTMLFTWFKNGKPDVSMTLNASLAGLVAITAPCATVDALGASIIGIVAGIIVVVVVEGLDMKLHIDDPVGAVGVHLANGIWGTIADGLFNVESGVFYGGGFSHLGVQTLGEVAIVAWTTVCMVIVFTLIKKFHGLRASREEEVIGLDKLEHGIASSYAGFIMAPQVMTEGEAGVGGLSAAAAASAEVPVEKAVPVTKGTSRPDAKFHMVTIITRPSKFDELKHAMNDINVTGMTVANVMGCGQQHGNTEKYRGVPIEMTLLPKIKVDIVVSEVPVDLVVTAAKEVLYTGHIGDGKIFVYDVQNVVKVRTGEEGYEALQD
ncbi:ammonium transporter [Treponema sp. JC4]|uniref:ammonium transporter n=1 Tax=Treponema sp. JC4 TaxID=1124982 RepID=UPI00025B0A56|nr:ammonium transporter [Treponema sp. JC4]EID85444.1 ammonium transporter [Treponema sp. JC4]